MMNRTSTANASPPLENDTLKTGKVFLVGAGPGDPGLITLKAIECLKTADYVLYDGLVNPLLLRHSNAMAERTARAVTDGERILEQSEINARLIEVARQGKQVVRLKGGDPFIFGRGSEEAAALAKAGIEFEIIPGITAATAASEYAGISLTHREHASAVAFITGHEDPTKPDSALDYANLAHFPGTLVFYMGLHRVGSIARRLISAGKSPQTPAAVICKASRPHQKTVTASLDQIEAAVAQAGLKPPSLIIIGSVVSLREQIAWFEKKPLFGQAIAITRPNLQADPQIQQISSLGGHPVLMPMIDVQPVSDWTEVDRMIDRLPEFRWIVFTSQNGVTSFLDRLWAKGKDSRALGSLKIACIGTKTAQALAEHRLQADLVPESYRSEDLADGLLATMKSGPVLWPRANRGREVLPERLQQAGIEIQTVVVYEHIDADAFSSDVILQLNANELHWVGISSPAIARRFSQLWNALPENPQRKLPKLASISPVTSETLRELGLPIDAEATQYTWDGIVQAIINS